MKRFGHMVVCQVNYTTKRAIGNLEDIEIADLSKAGAMACRGVASDNSGIAWVSGAGILTSKAMQSRPSGSAGYAQAVFASL